MAKQITFSKEAREKIMAGIDKLADTVKGTLGPKGKVVIFRRGDPIFSLDGVTIANNITLKDPEEAIGCDLVKDIASKTEKEAGDGTTTATLLAQVILKEGQKAIAAGIDTIGIKKGISQALDIAVRTIRKIAKPVKSKEDMANVGTIASRDPEIGKMIAEIFNEVGKEAIITVEEVKNIGLYKEIVEGMRFEHGFISPYFMTNPERGEAVAENPYILATDFHIKTNQEVFKLLEKITTTDSKSLVVIAEDVSGEALPTLVLNKMRGVVHSLAVKAPGFGEDKTAKLQDIAIMTGGQFISEEVGKRVEDVELADLGRADKVIADKGGTVIIGGKGKKSAIKKRIAILKKLIRDEESEYHKEIMTKRMAKLKGGVAVIKVGTISEQENKEKRFRIEDAVRATHSAIEEGIVLGAGMALIKCSKEIEKRMEKERDINVRTGLNILKEAIKEPARQIIRNAGGKPDVILENIQTKSASLLTGYNSDSGNYCDLVREGIIDPAKVVRVALENAVSVVSLFLVTEAIITDEPKKDEDANIKRETKRKENKV